MKNIFLILALLTVQMTYGQQSLYIQYESNTCIERFHFTVIEASSKSDVKEFYDFHVKLNATERTVIRSKKVGTFKKSEYKIKAGKINCSNIVTDVFQSMVGKIRTKEQSVFFVEEMGGELNIYQGIRATYDIYQTQYFFSYSPDYSFKYTYANNYDPLQTLRYDEEKEVTTYFAGKKNRDCREQFGIYALPDQASKSQISMEFIHNMGLFEENNEHGMFTLNNVDGQPVRDYLNSLCATPVPPKDIPTKFNKLVGENTAKGDVQAEQPKPSDQSGKGKTGKSKKFEVIAKHKGGIIPSQYNKLDGQNTPKGDVATKKKVEIIAPYKGITNPIPTEYNNLPGQNTPKGGDIKAKKFEIIAPHKDGNKKDYQPMKPTKKETKKVIIDYPHGGSPAAYNASTKKAETVIINGLPKKYKVKDGDTLFFISKKFNISVKQLKEWNRLETEKLYTDEELIVGVVTAPL